mgnify:FL=1
MSTPRGGFNFNVGFITTQATAALNALKQQASQTAAGIQSSFQGANVNVGGLQATTANLKAAAAAAQGLKEKGELRISVRADGLQETVRDVTRLSASASQLANKRYSINITASPDQVNKNLDQIKNQLDQASKGQTVTVSIRASAADAQAALRTIEQNMQAAAGRGVRVRINLDTANVEAQVAKATEAQQLAQAKVQQKYVDGWIKAYEAQQASAAAHQQRIVDNQIKSFEAAQRAAQKASGWLFNYPSICRGRSSVSRPASTA